MNSPLLAIVLAQACMGAIPGPALEYVQALSLARQPVGNYFAPTYTSSLLVSNLPSQFTGGVRALSSSIYNLYARDGAVTNGSQAGYPLHMLSSDEVSPTPHPPPPHTLMHEHGH